MQSSVVTLPFRRLRHDLDLRDRGSPLPGGRPNAVRPGIAPADHHDVLALGRDRVAAGRRRLIVARAALVLLRQEIHREMDAVQPAARHCQVARPFGPAGQRHRIVIRQQRVDRHGHAHFDIRAKLDTFGRHLRHALVDQMLFHFEVGNAVAQQPANTVVLLVQRYRVSGAGELLRARHTRRP
jgi:hypothetical protein